MRLDLLGHAPRQRRIEVEIPAQRGNVLLDHAGHARPPVSAASTALAKRPHVLRPSDRRAAPLLVSA
jgi:hypothetical protein